jgi:hypothetical protein
MQGYCTFVDRMIMSDTNFDLFPLKGNIMSDTYFDVYFELDLKFRSSKVLLSFTLNLNIYLYGLDMIALYWFPYRLEFL